MSWGGGIELGSVPFLSSVSPRSLARLEERTELRSFDSGDVVFREGDPAEHLFVIRSGRIEVVDEDGPRLHVLRTMGSREIFGELGILGGHARSATARAADDSELWAIEREAFLELYEAEQVVALEIANAMARYLLDAEAIATDLLFLDLRGRIAKRLITATQAMDVERIAMLAGGSARRVSELLAEMESGGLIRVADGEVTVVDGPGVAELATHR